MTDGAPSADASSGQGGPDGYRPGWWPSPLSAAQVAAPGSRPSEVQVADGSIFWSESRPDEDGRVAVVRWYPERGAVDVVPVDADVRTRVNEYGGGAWRAAPGVVYASLRSDARGERVSRVEQIVQWLGKDFDGVVIFDEAHAMQNAAGGKGERGDVSPSQQGRAGLRLQHALPNARIVYVSATGATTVHNLAYAQRLGLWGGEDFPFSTRAEFVEAIEAGGVAAMEVLARDLRALGL